MYWRLFGSCLPRNILRGSFAARGNPRWYSVAEQIVRPVRIINQPPGSEILISERAFKRLADIYRDSREVLKVAVESGGCHGFQYNMTLIPDAQVEKEIMELGNGNSSSGTANEVAKDEDSDDFDEGFEDNKDVIFILPEEGGKVVVDENSLKILNNTILTYSTELIGSTFKIAGGKMKSSCGCGSSFDVDPEK